MRRGAHRIASLLAAAALALPGAAWGQSAGDDQYEDPFAPQPGQDDGGGSSQGDGGSSGGGSSGGGSSDGGSSGGGTVEPAAPAEPATVPATTAQAPNGAPELPRTGADAGPIALAGVLLVASGVALRVRLSAPAPPRARLSAPGRRRRRRAGRA